LTTLRAAPGVRAMPESWPFAPIEELDYYLETAVEPSLIQLETHVQGHLDPAALASALAVTLAAEPAARRHLAGTSRWHRRLHWEAAPPGIRAGTAAVPLTVTRWDRAEELAELRERLSAWPIPLHDEAIRLTLAAGQERDVVILQTHHAAFDGISSVTLLASICAAYRRRARVTAGSRLDGDGGPVSAPPLAPAPPPAPTGPARPCRPWRTWVPRLPGAVTRIAPQDRSPGRSGYGSVRRPVPVPRPVRRGRGPFPTVNDLLVTALVLTVERWNTAHGRRGGLIRIGIPVNDRDPRHWWAGSGNQTRLIRITARPRQRADPAVLLEHVAAQTRAARRQPRPGLDAASRLLAAGWAPTAVKRNTARLVQRLAAPVGTDTSVISNLGVIPDPPTFSGSGQEPLWFSGPARMPRGLGVGAATVGGRLHVCVHYQHALLGREAAERFTRMYCQALDELAGLPEGRPA
jgi:NRPS condensation-like uncharacterized protein